MEFACSVGTNHSFYLSTLSLAETGVTFEIHALILPDFCLMSTHRRLRQRLRITAPEAITMYRLD
ncbi:hypothetical protein F4W66_24830 (plasmid) [Escherichia coli]|nr:hypothetical protein F4W66_24830 [Escherichia coli]